MPESVQREKPSARLLSLKRVSIRKLIPDEETAIRALGYFYFDHPEKCKNCWRKGGGLIVRSLGSKVFKCLECNQKYLITNMPKYKPSELSCGMERTRIPLHLWFHCWHLHFHKGYGYKRLMKVLPLKNRRTVKRMCKLISDQLYIAIISQYILLERGY